MNYIRKHIHGHYGAGKTTLVDAITYESIFNNGGTLTVNEGGYTLTTESGQVIAEGTESDAIKAVKSLDFYIEALTVKDEARGVTLPYSEYRQKYDHGNVNRDFNKKRKFFAYLIKDEEAGATGIGIAEKYEGYTHAVHSIYEPKAMNKFARAQYVVDYINSILYANEYAYIQAIGAIYPNVRDRLDKEHVRIQGAISSVVSAEETEKLAIDALRRKNTVAETFEKSFKYVKDVEEDGEKEE